MSHDPVAQTITLDPIQPNAPIVVCDSPFLHTLSVVEREVALIAISDAQSAQAAANLQQRLTSAGRKLEDVRTALKAPFLQKGREIDDAAKAPATRIEAAKRAVNAKLVAFEVAERKRAAEAETARWAELERLERLRLAEEEAARKKAEELAKQMAEAAAKSKAPIMEIDFDDDTPANGTVEYGPPKTEVEKQIEAVRYAPAVVAAKPVGVSFRSRLIIASTDVTKLPDMFVIKTPNEKAIRSTFCEGWKEGEPVPECAGVTFKVDRISVSTGRSVF